MRISTLVLLAGMTCGCNAERVVSPAKGPPQEPLSALHLEVAADPVVVERGGVLHVRLTVTNETDAPIRMGFCSGCIYGFALRNQRGDVAAPPPPVCTQDAPIVTYMPGEAVSAAFEWTYDDPGIRPGAYDVTAGLGPRGAVESPPPVRITLR